MLYNIAIYQHLMGTIGVSLKKDLIKRLDDIVANDRSIFQNRSQVIAHCCLDSLPEIEAEVAKK